MNYSSSVETVSYRAQFIWSFTDQSHNTRYDGQWAAAGRQASEQTKIIFEDTVIKYDDLPLHMSPRKGYIQIGSNEPMKGVFQCVVSKLPG